MLDVLIIAGAAMGLPIGILAGVLVLGFVMRTTESFIAGREARKAGPRQANAIIPPDAFAPPPAPPKPAAPAAKAAPAKPAAPAAAKPAAPPPQPPANARPGPPASPEKSSEPPS